MENSFPPFEPMGMATGIGSLPHLSPERAVELILEYLPDCPFWPQLPRLSPLEGMTSQYVEFMPGLTDSEGSKVDTGEAGHEALEEFYRKLLSGDLDANPLTHGRSRGFPVFIKALERGEGAKALYLKGHVTGPVTLASSLKDAQGMEITHNNHFSDAVAHLLGANARWQIATLGRFGRRVIIFLDEPVMEVFGSAYSSLDAETVHALWQPVLDAIREAGGLSGIHCCGNTDWGVLFSSGVDIVNFDAYQYLEKLTLYPGEVASFLGRGGVLAWGIVPTDARAEEETGPKLLERLEAGIELFAAQGVEADLLRRRCLITPSCGMGSLGVDLSERIVALLSETSALFQKKWSRK